MTNDQKPRRKAIRLKEYDYSLPGHYYLTICTQNRRCLLGKIIDEKMVLNRYGKIVNKYWRKLPEKFNNISLDEYIIMPNHLHGIIVINDDVPNNVGAGFSRPKISLGQIVAWFKLSIHQTNKLYYLRFGGNNRQRARRPDKKRVGKPDPYRQKIPI